MTAFEHQSDVLRDIIYFDFDKAASLFSQLEGGFLREVQSTLEGTSATTFRGRVTAGVFGSGVESHTMERQGALETRVVYHDLLARLEAKLFELGVIADIGGGATDAGSVGAARETVDESAY